MNETPQITIDDFCYHLINNYGRYHLVGTEQLAKEFIRFFGVYSPFSFIHLELLCRYLDIVIKNLPDDSKPRGCNINDRGNVQIFIKENDSTSGKIYTILHELYEIIIEKFYSTCNNQWKWEREDIEAKANKFAAYVQIPDKIVLQWINTKGLDVFGLADLLTCSHVTVLIRMNEVLCKFPEKTKGKFLPVINILYEKPYREEMANIETGKLQLKTFVKSKGFSFRLSQNEINELLFHNKEHSINLSIPSLIDSFSNYGFDSLLMNTEMEFRTFRLKVDILIRGIKRWKYGSCIKILIQLMPSTRKELRELAERLNLKKDDFEQMEVDY